VTGAWTIEWNPLLEVVASAAATLMGLVFVAVSINMSTIMNYPGLPDRAAESILQFLTMFLIALVALVPRQPRWSLAVEFLSIAAVSWVAQAIGQIRYLRLRAGHPWFWFALRAVLGQLATVPFGVAGIALLWGAPEALYWLAPGFVFSFVAGVVSSWILLVEVLR
jgi:modulator of FtsH protease